MVRAELIGLGIMHVLHVRGVGHSAREWMLMEVSMPKKSNGKLRKARLVERALRKGVDLSVQPTAGYAYVYGGSNAHLTAQRG